MAIKFLNTVQVDTDVLYVDTANSNVGIGTSSPSTYFTLDVNGSANFLSDIQVGRNATALSFDMNPGYDSGSYHLKLYKNQTNDGGVLLYSKPTSGSAQLDWQIVNQGTAGDLKFYAYGLAGNALILDRETGNLQLPEYGAGTLVSDASGNITVSSGGGAGGPYLPLAGGTMTGDIVLNDTVKTVYGTANDGLWIYHDGSNSYVNDVGTGTLNLRGSTQVLIGGTNGEVGIQYVENAGVGLRHNNVAKLTTESTGVAVVGNITVDSALLSNQENTDIDTGAEVVAQVAHATYTAAFFDFVVKKGTNVRSGTVYACHDGTNVEFTETSTNDLGDTSDVVLSVDISGTQMRLIATAASDDWIVKSLIRAI